MADYVNLTIEEDYIAVSFYIEYDKPLAIGNKMQELVDEAYMNGYNWEAFFNAYLEENAPEILDVIDPDSEAGMYSVYIEDVNEETKDLAKRFVDIIEHLVENEHEIYDFLEEHAADIEWD